MSPPRATRRSVIRTGGTIAAVLGTGSLAGCVEGLGNSGTAGSDRLGHVPPVADAVFTTDVNTFFADDGVRNAYNAWIETRTQIPEYEGPTSLAETLDEFEQREGADLRDLSRFTAAFSYEGESAVTSNDGTGFFFEGGWDESTVLSIFDNEYTNYTESSYADYTIYEGEEEYDATIGVLEAGSYVAGGPDAVHGAIDVHRGETDPIDGPVADAYRDTAAGPVRFATDVRAEWIPKEAGSEEMSIDLSALRSVETAAGAIYRDGTARGIETTLNAPDAATAEDLTTVVDGLLTIAEGRASGEYVPEFVPNLLADVEVSQDGPSVAATVERTVSELEEMAKQFGEMTHGSVSESQSASGEAYQVPQVSFEWSYDAEARTVTVTHQAGDAVDAGRLWIHGEGFAAVEGADVTEPTSWAEATGDEQVTAGKRLTVGAASDCTFRMVWTESDASATLGSYAGPDA